MNELLTYLMMYRSTLHTVTPVSPSNMLYGRIIHTKLPEICQLKNTCIEMAKCKLTLGGMHKEINHVVMKQKKTDKLSTNFNPNPMKIGSKGRNGVLVDSYRRNVTNLNKSQIHQSDCGDGEVG